MKVKDLIKELQKFNPELEVTITDGCYSQHYIGDFEVTIFEDHNENVFVDIEIGGLNENVFVDIEIGGLNENEE